MDESGVRFDVTDEATDDALWEQTAREESQAQLDLFARHRGLLLSIAYRMLGSASDAEDMLQETYLRWQQMAREEVRSPRAMLVTVYAASSADLNGVSGRFFVRLRERSTKPVTRDAETAKRLWNVSAQLCGL